MLVLWAEGPSGGGGFAVLTLLLLLVPILSSAVLLRAGMGPRAKIVAAIGNLALLGFVIWAFAVAYPTHPEEAGVLPFALVCAVTPILNVLVLLRRGAGLKSARGA